MAVDIESVKVQISKTNKAFLNIAGVVIAITGVAGGFSWYLNHFWKPKVVVESVDFKNATAKISVNNLVGSKPFDIYGNANFSISQFGDWGVRFGTSDIEGAGNVYNRLELTKNNLVIEYLEAKGSVLVQNV
jgi:small basic protein